MTRIPQAALPRPRQYLSADGLIATLRNCFAAYQDSRRSGSVQYSLVDTLMSAFAMFSLKDPSLLAFQGRRNDATIQNLYRLQAIPCDTQMRSILDGLDLEPLHEAFAELFFHLQRDGELKKFLFDGQYYLVAIDGTQHFCSTAVRCEQCLRHKGRGDQQRYVHQAVVASLVHPDRKETIPLGIEPIVQQDGQQKNDCERNATRRLLRRLRAQHPKLPMVIIEDGLASNAPHIEDLKAAKLHFLLAAKPGDHQFLFEQFLAASDAGRCEVVASMRQSSDSVPFSETSYVENLPLNASRAEVRVNFLHHLELEPQQGEVRKQFSWVSDLAIPPTLRTQYVRAGRSRWHIENAVFNTLKNQGYCLEHNYGHGKINLASVLAVLMLLAFAVDQIQQLACPLFAAAAATVGAKIRFWEKLRSHAEHFVFTSFAELWAAMATGSCKGLPPPVRWR